VKSFFIQLFLCFWVATFGIMAATFVFLRDQPASAPPKMLEPVEQLTTRLVQLSIQEVRSQGCESALDVQVDDISLFGPTHRPVCAAHASSDLVSNLDDNAVPRWIRRGTDIFQVGSMRDPTGGLWYYVARIPEAPEPGVLLPFAYTALPSSALVSLLFAYFLARPVRALSTTIRAFSAGDLSARATVPKGILGSGGSGDLETLTRDFNAMATQIQSLVEAHQTLIRDVSHELRTPLTRIRMALELTREEPESSAHYLVRMDGECARLDQLLSGILRLSQVGRLETIERIHILDLAAVIRMIIEDARLEATQQGVSLDFRSSAKAMVRGDPELLRQAIENVVRNAIRFSPSSEAVEVYLETKPGGAGTALVTVQDRGPGMSKANLEKVFAPFFRVPSDAKDAPAGFGVGLAIAQQVVHLHHGTISADRRPGGGLMVAIALPLAEKTSIHLDDSADLLTEHLVSSGGR
jgi:two-component system, OmpR family, sensor histidine kinase CpxA